MKQTNKCWMLKSWPTNTHSLHLSKWCKNGTSKKLIFEEQNKVEDIWSPDKITFLRVVQLELGSFRCSTSFISSHQIHPMSSTKMGFQLINPGIHSFAHSALMSSWKMYLHVVPLIPDCLWAQCAEVWAWNLGIRHEKVLGPQRATWKRRENYESLPSLSGRKISIPLHT